MCLTCTCHIIWPFYALHAYIPLEIHLLIRVSFLQALKALLMWWGHKLNISTIAIGRSFTRSAPLLRLTSSSFLSICTFSPLGSLSYSYSTNSSLLFCVLLSRLFLFLTITQSLNLTLGLFHPLNMSTKHTNTILSLSVSFMLQQTGSCYPDSLF